jgi:hypothetical protein
MTLTPELSNALKISTGIFWTLTYILIIMRGFRDKTYGMPLFPLCANLAWEFIFSFIFVPDGVQRIINPIWFVFDLIIVYQYLRYGKSSLKGTLLEKYFYLNFVAVLLTGFFATLTASIEFNSLNGKYAAFTGNLIMSIMFISFLISRNNVEGQSIYVAIFKMIGTIFASTLFYLRDPGAPYMGFLYVAILFFDLAYVFLLYRMFQIQGINPWTRQPVIPAKAQSTKA